LFPTNLARPSLAAQSSSASRAGAAGFLTLIQCADRPEYLRRALLPLGDPPSLTHPTLELLHQLGLAGMAKAFGDTEASAEATALSHPEWLALLLDGELSHRRDKCLLARLRYPRGTAGDTARAQIWRQSGSLFHCQLRSVKGGVTEYLAAAGFAREQIVDGSKLFCAIATKP